MTRKGRKQSSWQNRVLLLLCLILVAIAIPTGLALTQTAARLTLFTFLGQATPIQTLQQATDAQGTTVILEGTVRDRVPLVNAQVYQLQDATGKIWVVSSDSRFSIGETVRIRGKLRFESIPVEAQEFGEIYVQQD